MKLILVGLSVLLSTSGFTMDFSGGNEAVERVRKFKILGFEEKDDLWIVDIAAGATSDDAYFNRKLATKASAFSGYIDGLHENGISIMDKERKALQTFYIKRTDHVEEFEKVVQMLQNLKVAHADVSGSMELATVIHPNSYEIEYVVRSLKIVPDRRFKRVVQDTNTSPKHLFRVGE